MKKQVFLLFVLLVMTAVSYSQTVENIRVEQEGEKLMIHYRIGGSTSEQLYDVTLTAKIDNRPIFEPKSVIGDVGGNIRGGKSFNTIVWDVFEDVEEIGDIEFFVEVDLTKDEGQKTPAISEIEKTPALVSNYRERHVVLAYSGTTISNIGAKIGYLDNWGVYGAMRFGFDFYYYTNAEDLYLSLELTGGIAKRVYQKNKFRTYMYAGAAYGSALYEYSDYLNSANDYTYNDYYGTFDIGSMAVFGMLYADLGISFNSYYGADLIFGIGLVF